MAEYYRPSYLQAQEMRGNAISRALLKYGYSSFSLSIQEIGPTETGQVYSVNNIPVAFGECSFRTTIFRQLYFSL